MKFLDSAHIKDVLACLRWAENPRDRVAGFRVLQLLPGVGPTTAAGILDATDRAVSVLTDIAAPPRVGAEWRSFKGLMERVVTLPSDIIAFFLTDGLSASPHSSNARPEPAFPGRPPRV